MSSLHLTLRRCLVAGLLALPLVWLFRSALFFGEVFAFRDVSFYYFPYYEFVQQLWQDGIPLWNPLDGIGQPLLADPTAAVLYPGKLIFLLPSSYRLCFTIYLLFHAWLAGLGAYALARKINAAPLAATLAGLSYELSGQVIFQYCNPIYLVGSAWLPWALLCFLNLREQKHRTRPTILLSIVLSMMVLGGDPQMAMHCALCVGIWFGVQFRARLKPSWRFTNYAGLRSVSLAMVSALGIAFLLSSVQILPTKRMGSSKRSLSSRHSSFAMGNGCAGLAPNERTLETRRQRRPTSVEDL